MSRILVADDDAAVNSFLDRGLRAAGFATYVTRDGRQAELLGLAGRLDLLILGTELPGRDGVRVLRELRRRGLRVPVLVLTGRPDVFDVATCLDAGADDHLAKPFRFDELLARVRARLRPRATAQPRVLGRDGLQLDLRTRRARVRDRQVELTAREFAVLSVLLRHSDQVLSREQLLSEVWGYCFDPGSNIVNAYVAALRRKLGTEAIETVRGAGYRLRPAAS